MERLTKRTETGVAYLADPITLRSSMEDRGKVHTMIDRLADYEDTGLEPEQVTELKGFIQGGVQKVDDGWAHVQELLQAEQEGRLVVLDEPRLPLIWGDDDHDTILCPNCGQDLMGGFELADTCEVTIVQCPYCGQPIDGTKALTREEAEKALRGGSSDDP